MIAIVLSMVMMYITSFSVNVLIRPIVQDLETTVATLQAVIVSASFIAGAFMVTAGRLGDKLGKKKVFVTGIAIYTLGLLVVVLSPNTAVFALGWGVIWPAGMVLIIPTSIALIMYFYEGRQRALAFGVYGAVLSAVSAVAPVVVGLLADQIGWRLALSLSPAIGIVTLLVSLTLPVTDRDRSIRIDLPSVVLSVLGFGLFLFGTTLAGQYGWFLARRPFSIGETELPLFGLSVTPVLYAASILFLVLFFARAHQVKLRGEAPLLNAALLRNREFALGMGMGAIFFLVNAGFLFAISIFLQTGVRLDSFQTALTTVPYTAVLAVLALSTPGLGRKIAPKWIVALGCAVMGVGIWLTGQMATIDMKPMDLLLPMVLVGAGGGLIMAQYTSITMMTVKPEQSGEASGLSETLKEIVGQGFAVALAGSILFGAVYASMVDSYASIEDVPLTAEEHQEMVVELEDTFQDITDAEEAEFVQSLPEKTRRAYAGVVEDATLAGLRSALTAMTVAIALCLGLAFLVPARKLD